MSSQQTHRTPRPVLLAALALTVGAATALPAAAHAGTTSRPAASAHARTTASGWRAVWSDEFSGTGKLGSGWLYRVGTAVPGGPANFGTGEIEYNTDSLANVEQRGGALHIRALRDATGAWTSGRVETTRDDFAAPSGGTLAVESRLQLPNRTGAAGRGYWPAFWMLGTPYRSDGWSWPGIGEMDIMENVQGLNTEYGTFHCGTAPGGDCNEKDGLSANTPGGSPSLQTGMHVYRVEWDRSTAPEQIRWYLDGRLFHTVRQTDVSQASWQKAFSHGYFLLLNLAVGGEFPAKMGGGPDAATVPGGELVVDYVRVSSRGGAGTTAPTPTPTPKPTGTTKPTPTTQPTPAPTGPGCALTPTPTPAPADGTLQAEAAAGRYGQMTNGDGSYVGELRTGDWLRYDAFTFGALDPGTFTARVASDAPAGVSGVVELRIDSPTAPPVARIEVANTGGAQSWRELSVNLSVAPGTHDVYVTTTSGQPAAFVNLDWVRLH